MSIEHGNEARAPAGDVEGHSDEILQQINKRLTLNLLIQGAASHTFLTAHHLVADELEELRPGLTRLYDRMVISGHLNYWIGDLPLMYGFAFWFWGRTHRPGPISSTSIAGHTRRGTRPRIKTLSRRARLEKVGHWYPGDPLYPDAPTTFTAPFTATGPATMPSRSARV